MFLQAISLILSLAQQSAIIRNNWSWLLVNCPNDQVHDDVDNVVVEGTGGVPDGPVVPSVQCVLHPLSLVVILANNEETFH